MRQIFSIEPLHGQKPLTHRRNTMRNGGNNARVAKLGEKLRFAIEAL